MHSHLKSINSTQPDYPMLLQKIQHADLSFVEERLVKVNKWKRVHAQAAVAQYKNYLFIKMKYADKTLPPSIEIDEAWHAHILHTKEYFIFCDELFGEYLHHQPHKAGAKLSESDMQALFFETQELYHREFGSYIMTIIKPFYINVINAVLALLRVAHRV